MTVYQLCMTMDYALLCTTVHQLCILPDCARLCSSGRVGGESVGINGTKPVRQKHQCSNRTTHLWHFVHNRLLRTIHQMVMYNKHRWKKEIRWTWPPKNLEELLKGLEPSIPNTHHKPTVNACSWNQVSERIKQSNKYTPPSIASEVPTPW